MYMTAGSNCCHPDNKNWFISLPKRSWKLDQLLRCTSDNTLNLLFLIEWTESESSEKIKHITDKIECKVTTDSVSHKMEMR